MKCAYVGGCPTDAAFACTCEGEGVTETRNLCEEHAEAAATIVQIFGWKLTVRPIAANDVEPPKMTCSECGVECNVPLCLDCFIGRPFVKNIGCRICGKQRPIVRQYLDGAACDACEAVRKEARAAKAAAAKAGGPS